MGSHTKEKGVDFSIENNTYTSQNNYFQRTNRPFKYQLTAFPNSYRTNKWHDFFFFKKGKIISFSSAFNFQPRGKFLGVKVPTRYHNLEFKVIPHIFWTNALFTQGK